MCDLVGVKKISQTYGSLRYNGVRFFPSIKRHEKIFSLEISLYTRYFFLTSPIPLRPIKSQMVGP